MKNINKNKMMKTKIIVQIVTVTLIVFGGVFSIQWVSSKDQRTTKNYTLDLSELKIVAQVDERYQSFNVEMCEVVGGDFWIPYELKDSVKKHSDKKGFAALKWRIPPINLYDKKLRMLASALGPTYVRVSGTWANAVYFQNNDDPILNMPPKGYQNILTRKQWKGVIDFCKAVDGKLVTSFAISDGMRDANGNWTPVQVESLLDYTKSIGGEISAAAMFNEPSHASHGDAPENYDAQKFAEDFAAFKSYIRTAATDMKILGPGSTGEGGILRYGISIHTEDMLAAEPNPVFDIFSYHYYGAVSKRCMGRQNPQKALSHEWLSKTEIGYGFYEGLRDKFTPGTPIWLTETAETACGGNTWAATYVDCFRYLEQLGRLAKKDVQVVMHNTLARSEYALLDNNTHEPRPNYWAALLWNRLMGTKVYDAGIQDAGVDIFAHNLKKSTNGFAVLAINPQDVEAHLTIPSTAEQYLLTADELETKTIKLNGEELSLTKNGELPDINGKKINPGKIKLPPYSIVFLTFNNN